MQTTRLVMSFLAGALITTAAAAAEPAPTLESRVDALLESRREALIEFRRDLHRHPELAGEEARTAGRIAARLEELGLEVRTGVGGHGVVAVLEGGLPGRVVAYRADMDAVRSPAPDPVPFASEVPGVRHICGHDIHVTVAMAIAEALAPQADQLPGTLVLLFQPAEETGEGALAMIKDGAMRSPVPEAIYAVHSAPLPVGQIAAGTGPTLPQRDRFSIQIEGAGDLDAAVRAVRKLIQEITVLDPKVARTGGSTTEPFAVAQIFRTAGEGASRTIAGQTTAYDRESSAGAQRRLREGLAALADETISLELDYRERTLSGVDNDPARVERAGAVIAERLGEERFRVATGVSPLFSEDFGFLQDHAPGVMFWLGVSNPEKGTLGLPHSPLFVADEEAITVGAKAMSAVLLEALAPEKVDPAAGS